MRGWLAIGASILLVSSAQLAMKWGMSHLTVQNNVLPYGLSPLLCWALLCVLGGIIAYLASMVCWMVALSEIPLKRAYPLLSLSYAIVYIAAIVLPYFNETFAWSRAVGVVLIIAGITVMNWRRQPSSDIG